MLYRILTEDKPEMNAEVLEIVSAMFTGFTVFGAEGYWKGEPEMSMVIEIEAPLDRQNDVRILCLSIKNVLKQENVMLQILASKTELI